MRDQIIDANNTKSVKSGGGVAKKGMIKGKLIKNVGLDPNNIEYSEIAITADDKAYKGLASSFAVKLFKKLDGVDLKFDNNTTLIKVYVYLKRDNLLYNKSFYKNKGSSDSSEFIKYDNYIVKDVREGIDKGVLDDDSFNLQKLKRALDVLSKSYYITYTINNYKNYFFCINEQEDNISDIMQILETNFSENQSYKNEVSEYMNKIEKNIRKSIRDDA